jgi:hypothetical protein
MSIDRITAIRAKVERAKEHIRNLESRVYGFLASQPYNVVPDDNLKPGRRCIVVADVAPIPLAIPIILGDVLQNLRSALDHLIYNLVIANTGSDPKDSKIMFPIFDCASKYETGSLRKVRGVHKEAIDLIGALKPYRGGNDALWGLNELNNIDKHRLLIMVGYYYSTFVIDFDAVLKESMKKRTIPYVIARSEDAEIIDFLLKDIPSMPISLKPPDITIEKGAVLLDFPADELAFETYTNAKFTFNIALGESQIFKGNPILPTIHQLLNLVEGIIKPFHPFLV